MIESTSDLIVVYSPEAELEILSNFAGQGNQIDWKPAIILSATYLEKYGIEKLKTYFGKKEIKLANKIERLSLPDVNMFLYGLGLIESKYFNWIERIWDERRDIIHQKGELPLYIGEEANKKYRKMIDRALEVLKFLKR
jgi:hypothetical protein